jgi:hypothetical protein
MKKKKESLRTIIILYVDSGLAFGCGLYILVKLLTSKMQFNDILLCCYLLVSFFVLSVYLILRASKAIGDKFRIGIIWLILAFLASVIYILSLASFGVFSQQGVLGLTIVTVWLMMFSSRLFFRK